MNGRSSFVQYITFDRPKYITAIKLLMKKPTEWDVIGHRMLVAWVEDIIVQFGTRV